MSLTDASQPAIFRRVSEPTPVILTVEPHHGYFVVYSLEGGP